MSPTLFRYVARLYLTLFVGAFLSVLVIFVVVDFGDRLKAFVDRPAAELLLLYGYKVVVAAHQLAPAAMLLSAGAAVSILRRRGEWTALQSVGASSWAVVAPIAACTLVLAGGFIAFDEFAVTRSATKMDVLLATRFHSWGEYRFFYVPKQWLRVGDTVFHVRGEPGSDKSLNDVSILKLGKDFALDERLDVRRMESLGKTRWRLFDVERRRFLADGTSPQEQLPSMEVDLPGTTPATFMIRAGRPEAMRVPDLRRQQVVRAAVGLPAERFGLALHNRFAYPLTGMVAALLAVMLALRPQRRGHLTLALVEGLVVSMLLFGMTLVGKTMVLAQHASPAAAAWGPLVGLSLAVAALWLHVEGKLPLAAGLSSARR